MTARKNGEMYLKCRRCKRCQTLENQNKTNFKKYIIYKIKINKGKENQLSIKLSQISIIFSFPSLCDPFVSLTQDHGLCQADILPLTQVSAISHVSVLIPGD